MSTCLHRFTPDTNLVQTKIGAVETFAKLFFGKSKPFSVIYEPSYLGFSEEICRIFQPPPLTYHAYYAPHTPYTNLLGHHFGSSSGLAWFGRFGPVWVESAPRCCDVTIWIQYCICTGSQMPTRSHPIWFSLHRVIFIFPVLFSSTLHRSKLDR